MINDGATVTRIGNTWHFETGETLPVVAGADGEVAPAAVEPGTETPEADFSDQALPEGQDHFDRPYVEKLRNEAASYRTKYREANAYQEAFGSAEDRETWRKLASTLYTDQVAGAQWMANIARDLGAGMTDEQAIKAAGPEPATITPPAAVPAPKSLTADDVERMFTERDAKQHMDKAIKAVETDAQGLGYKMGSKEYVSLLHLAANTTGGDLSKAHAIMEADKQAIIDAYVASKAAETGSRGPGNQGSAPTGERPIKTLKDAEGAMRARLAAMRNS